MKIVFASIGLVIVLAVLWNFRRVGTHNHAAGSDDLASYDSTDGNLPPGVH